MMRLLPLSSLGLLLCLSGTALATPYWKLPPVTISERPIAVQPPSDRPQRHTQPLVITLQRTACFGFCPIYKLTITGDGKVVYEGERFVKVQGTRTAKISRAAVQQLMSEFERINYFKLQDNYTGGHTDAPSVITSATLSKRTKTIHHYTASPDAPKTLTELENKIDAVVNISQWIGTERDRMPAQGR